MLRRLLALSLLGCAAEVTVTDTDPGAEPPQPDTAAPDEPSRAPPGFTLAHTLSLRLQDAAPPELTLDLDRSDVEDLLGSVADQIVLLRLDPVPLLEGALTQIKQACGDDWMRDTPSPTFDCSLTELGRSFRGPDGTWRTSAELSLIGILTMTPANADVRDTSIARTQAVADFIGLDFRQILADTLAISRTTPFIDTAPLARGLRDSIMASHPAVDPDGRIPITLEDALTDLRTLGERLGPSGRHPGIVDPEVPVRGAVLTELFAMRAVVRSNLRVLDGIDLSDGKGWAGVIVDPSGTGAPDAVEFDFTDPERFEIRGLVDDPRIDLTVQMSEKRGFVPACVGVRAGADCRENLPGNPVNRGGVWDIDPWWIESVVGYAGREDHGALVATVRYLAGLVQVRTGAGADPPGFTRFSVPLNLGDPPEPQYVWELINEVAQRRLHDGPAGLFNEGEGKVRFTVTDVPVGLDTATLTAAVGPEMAKQNGRISQLLLGDFRDRSSPVELFYRRSTDGRPMLVWVGEQDQDPRDVRRYATPGLFADEALTRKLSATVIAGDADATREKWVVPPGASTLYATDDTGLVYRLDLDAPDQSHPAAELEVTVWRQVR